jgi:ketosteroid isomerase-like protein
MSVYARGDDIVAYDVVPPLQYRGYDAYRKDYQDFLAMFEGPLEVEFRGLRVFAAGDVGFVHTLERVTGKMKTGQKTDMWLRATSGVRKMDGKWLIVHDHSSVPADFETGKALLELKP